MKPGFLILLFLTALKITAQEKNSVDFKHLQAEVTIIPSEAAVKGKLVYTFDILQPTDTVSIDARKMDFEKVLLNGEKIRFFNDEKQLHLLSSFEESEANSLSFTYTAFPKQTMYFINTRPEGEPAEYQVWTQGQGKYTSHWLPSFDHTSEKVEFDLTIFYENEKQVVANGLLQKSEAVNDTLTRWAYDMEQPMSSYLVAVAAGDFERVEEISENGIFMHHYFPRGMEDLVEPTYRYSKEIMFFLEKETGVKYPWQNYKQIPVRDFLYAGMENTGATIFSDIFLVDSTGFNDRNYVNVNAHEMAHQWFGNMVTATSGEHHWLQEGFATYYALLAEKEVFGEDYFYWNLYQSAEALKQMSDSGKGESLLNPNASSLTFYQKGAWALHILRELIGKEAFNKAMKNYLEKYSFGMVTTQDFMAEVEQVTAKDLSAFRDDWLLQSAFQGTAALESLKRSAFIRSYLEVAAQKPLPIESKREKLAGAFNFPVKDRVGEEAAYQLALEDPLEVIDLYKKAFDSNNLSVRQAIAFSLQRIPQQLKSRYESLLKDDSYVTREAALFNLWMNFPQDRLRYLQETDGQQGYLDGNLRTLWLALSLATPEIPQNLKKEYLEELSGYTAPHQRFQLRQNAFDYLFQLNAFSSRNIYDLLDASRHHNFRFRDFARKMLKQVLKMENLLPEDKALLEQHLGINSQVQN